MCTKCNYLWKTRSKMRWVTCPNCQKKVKIKEVDEDEYTN